MLRSTLSRFFSREGFSQICVPWVSVLWLSLLLVVPFHVRLGISEAYSEETSRTRFKVGVIAGFSGELAAYGAAFRAGIELAQVQDILDVIYEDDEFLPAKTVSAFHKLVNVGGAQALIVGDTATASAIAALAQRARVPILVWASEQRAFDGNPFVLRLWPKDRDDLGFVTHQFRERAKQWKKVAVLSSSHPYADQWGTVLASSFPDTISWHERFTTDPADLKPYVMRLRAGGFDAVGFCLNSPQNGLLLKAMKELRLKLPTFACNFVEASSDLEKARGEFEGLWFTAPAVTANFREAYLKRVGTTDHIFSAAVYHDAARVLADAAAASNSREDLIEKLRGLQVFEGALGRVELLADKNDWYFKFPFAVFEFRQGRVQLQNK